MTKIRFLQSSDPEKYSAMLVETSRSVIEYCRRHGCEYEMFVGIRHGAKPWHAALNRIAMLKRYVDRGYSGWAVYLDADAYIADLDFDLLNYLEARGDRSFIATGSGAPPFEWWNVNNGVFAINLGHAHGREIIARWNAILSAISKDELANEPCWGAVIDDQSALHEVLRGYPETHHSFERGDAVFNWNGQFIRQIVRADGSLEYRTRRLRQLVDATLGNEGIGHGVGTADLHRDFIHGVYHVLLQRDPDPTGLDNTLALLESGERNYMQELTACLESEEFFLKSIDVLKRYLSPERFAAVARDLPLQSAAA